MRSSLLLHLVRSVSPRPRRNARILSVLRQRLIQGEFIMDGARELATELPMLLPGNAGRCAAGQSARCRYGNRSRRAADDRLAVEILDKEKAANRGDGGNSFSTTRYGLSSANRINRNNWKGSIA